MNAHHELVDLLAAKAVAEIKRMANRARRSIGQSIRRARERAAKQHWEKVNHDTSN